MYEHLFITPRSVLYNIEPIGTGSEFVESLTSYLARVAFEHNTSVGHLVNKLLIPSMDKDYLHRSRDFGGNRFYEGAKTINGYMENSLSVVKAIEKLTVRDDIHKLTLIRWKNVFPLRELLKKSLAWCPFCIKEWKENNKTVYYPLIWSIDLVHMCHIHSCFLINKCPTCFKQQDILRRQSLVGICQHCLRQLDDGATKEKYGQENKDWQGFVIDNVCSLLNYDGKINTGENSLLVKNLNLICEKVFDGSINEFSKQLNFARSSVVGWIKGKVKPTLENQLYICQRLNIEIEQLLLTTNIQNFHIVKQRKRIINTSSKPKRVDYYIVEKELEKVIQNKENISMEAASKKVGINKRTLYRKFRHLCVQISNHYKQYLEERKLQRILCLKIQVEATFTNLYMQGIYPSRRKIEFVMNKPGVLKERELQSHWKGLLGKQGLLFERNLGECEDIGDEFQ